MAKQSGIHQLRGKVGEHSYYRQTGVQSGLVRYINQAMSVRVKTDEAFANTRLNNAEFGQGGRIASMLANYISPKFRPMILPFSQSKMAKVLLEYIKQDTTAPWGQRNITTGNSGDAQVAALNAVSKNNFNDFGFNVTIDEESTEITIFQTAAAINRMQSIGADGVQIVFVAASSWIGTYSVAEGKYAPSYARGNRYDDVLNASDSAGTTINFAYTLRPAPPEGWPAFQATRMGVLIALPFRNINGTRHTLQEYCTYKAFVLEDGELA